jgi:hypothetical protein
MVTVVVAMDHCYHKKEDKAISTVAAVTTAYATGKIMCVKKIKI